jgi:hypothetical protein
VPDQVPGGVDLDREPGRPHPPRGERVRLVLGGVVAGAIRADPAADRVELLEPVEDAHGHRHIIVTGL